MRDATTTRRYGTFSYLPPFTDDELVQQVDAILRQGLIPAIEHTEDPGPRDAYWSIQGLAASFVTHRPAAG